jgi:hypothetical protein
MRPEEAIGRVEQEYLQALCDLADGKAKAGVSYIELQEHLALSDDEADRCCDFWTRRGAVAWSALGHVALTHLGMARARQIGGNGASRS